MARMHQAQVATQKQAETDSSSTRQMQQRNLTVSQARVMDLQRSAGNQAVNRVLLGQTAREAAERSSAAERQAERIAEHVSGSPNQRFSSPLHLSPPDEVDPVNACLLNDLT